MPLTGVKLENFTVFEKLEMEFSPGINVLIGPNGSGKTHLMKVLYSAVRATNPKTPFLDRMLHCFLPDDYEIDRLVCNKPQTVEATVTVIGLDRTDYQEYSISTRIPHQIERTSFENLVVEKIPPLYDLFWKRKSICTGSIFIPAKEMLLNTYKLNASVEVNHLAFDSTYLDVVNAAKIIALTEPMPEQEALLHRIEEITGGTVYYDERRDEFYLVRGDNQMEFSLVAEGIRKLALLWQLIHNRHLVKGSILFWDEPEANITPSNIPLIVDTLLELQRGGVQIFLATHDYFLCKYLDVRCKNSDSIQYHSLFRTEDSVAMENGEKFEELSHNSIIDTSINVYREEVEKVFAS